MRVHFVAKAERRQRFLHHKIAAQVRNGMLFEIVEDFIRILRPDNIPIHIRVA
jgi:hypothetical protein